MSPEDQPDITSWSYPLRMGETLSTNEWVEWHLHRFLSSRFVAYALSEGRRADIATAVILWSESYRQDPAGTLPDDDVELAALARFASVADWRAVREGVLYGWEPCLVEHADGHERPGRLGHAVIAEIARASYSRKRGKAVAREGAALAVVRSRVKARLIAMRRVSLAESKQVVLTVATFLHESKLWVTDDNIIAALESECGVPRVVDGGFGQKGPGRQ
jgi:hypothetical protein